MQIYGGVPKPNRYQAIFKNQEKQFRSFQQQILTYDSVSKPNFQKLRRITQKP